MDYHITCNTDDNYAQHCCAMLCSLFENNKELSFVVHVLTHDLSQNSKQCLDRLGNKYHQTVRICNVDETSLKGVLFRNKSRPLTMAAYYRLLLPDVLDKSINKVLYLDCDIIVLGSIRELFLLEIDQFALAACADIMPYSIEHRNQLSLQYNQRTFCSGLMMINLKYWREHDSSKKAIRFAKTSRGHVYLHDQDALNYVFKDEWFELPPYWNRSPLSISIVDKKTQYFDKEEFAFNPRLFHYAGREKPWMDVFFPNRSPYTKYLTLSGFTPVKFQELDRKTRLTIVLKSIRYYLNKYLHPLFPEIILLLVRDIVVIMTFLYTILFHYSGIKRFLLVNWLKKY